MQYKIKRIAKKKDMYSTGTKTVRGWEYECYYNGLSPYKTNNINMAFKKLKWFIDYLGTGAGEYFTVDEIQDKKK